MPSQVLHSACRAYRYLCVVCNGELTPASDVVALSSSLESELQDVYYLYVIGMQLWTTSVLSLAPELWMLQIRRLVEILLLARDCDGC